MIKRKIASILETTIEKDEFKNPIKVFENYNRILKYYENDEEFMKKLNNANINLDVYYLASISYQIQKFVELNFGRDAVKTNQTLFTKFPVSLFHDYSSNGSLSIMIKECLLYQINNQNKCPFDILSSSPKTINSETDEVLPILKKIESSLIHSKHLLRPVVCFQKNIPPKDRKVYKNMVRDVY